MVETEVTELDQVTAWRLTRLLALGFEMDLAEKLADRREVDVHAVEALIAAGCSRELAAEIVL